MNTNQPVMRRRRVEMYAVEALCNAFQPDMSHCQGQFQTVAQLGDRLFRHRCSVCGRESYFNETYPKMDHVLVDESSNEVQSLIKP